MIKIYLKYLKYFKYSAYLCVIINKDKYFIMTITNKNHFSDQRPDFIDIPQQIRKHKAYRDFVEFNSQNPHVLLRILKEIQRAKDTGLKVVSIKAIINYLRWQVNFETRSEDFKLNDKFTGLYTHFILWKFPHYKGVLTTRSLR